MVHVGCPLLTLTSYFRYGNIQNEMAAAAILINHSKGRISVAVARIDTIFSSETKIGVPEPEIP